MTDKTGPTESLTPHEPLLEPVELHAVAGPGKGAQATLAQGTLIVGSSSRADLTLHDPAVSRQHASFELLRGAVRVRDLQSRNGLTFLGAKVETATLPIGASLTIGRTLLRVSALAPDMSSELTELAGVIAHSPAMRALLWRVQRVADSSATVVVHGPTGSGKEAVARAIHSLSPRAKAPLVFFDCAAARGDLLESDLFGHVRGAFTGAVSARAGVIEQAHGGTLVLDNVDHLELQTRLLRFLEERRLRRVGGNIEKQIDVRVIALSQARLEDAVAEGRLRADVFYRLAEVVLEVPPLSRRLEDIPLLAARFAEEVAGIRVELSRQTIAALQSHSWPGNARELKNAVARGLAFGRFDTAPSETSAEAPAVDLKGARANVVSSFEADFLRALLTRHRWNVAAAARDAKIARSHLYTLMSRYRLSRG